MSKTILAAIAKTDKVIADEFWRDSDGYWLPLARGFMCALSDCHTIHELTVKEVLVAIKNIQPCDCAICQEGDQ